MIRFAAIYDYVKYIWLFDKKDTFNVNDYNEPTDLYRNEETSKTKKKKLKQKNYLTVLKLD